MIFPGISLWSNSNGSGIGVVIVVSTPFPSFSWPSLCWCLPTYLPTEGGQDNLGTVPPSRLLIRDLISVRGWSSSSSSRRISTDANRRLLSGFKGEKSSVFLSVMFGVDIHQLQRAGGPPRPRPRPPQYSPDIRMNYPLRIPISLGPSLPTYLPT